jgi:hypothetical protein
MAFFPFNRINNLRAFNRAFCSIPTAPTKTPADTDTPLANIATAQGSKAMALDSKTHRLYVPSMNAGHFTILVLDREMK